MLPWARVLWAFGLLTKSVYPACTCFRAMLWYLLPWCQGPQSWNCRFSKCTAPREWQNTWSVLGPGHICLVHDFLSQKHRCFEESLSSHLATWQGHQKLWESCQHFPSPCCSMSHRASSAVWSSVKLLGQSELEGVLWKSVGVLVESLESLFGQ